MITIERKALIAALTQVNKAIENRNTYPILSNVYLIATGDKLSIRATDLEIEITTSVACQATLPQPRRRPKSCWTLHASLAAKSP